MEYSIYCDESCHLEHDGQRAMVLGAVWCSDGHRAEAYRQLRDLKVRHGLSPRCELKWNAVSPAKLPYYLEVVDYFFDNADLHFRALVVPDKSVLKHQEYSQTHDGFYYKMYFNLLKTIFDPANGYKIFMDIKDTQGKSKIKKLHEVLCSANYDMDRSLVRHVQEVRSHEVELLQLADFFTGAISYVHRGLETSEAKLKIVAHIRQRSGYSLLRNTLYREDKMNVFVWKGFLHHSKDANPTAQNTL